MTFERIYVGTQDNLLGAIADKSARRDDVAGFYEDCLIAHRRQTEAIDWKRINEAIIERWSKSALNRIKKLAWKRAERIATP